MKDGKGNLRDHIVIAKKKKILYYFLKKSQIKKSFRSQFKPKFQKAVAATHAPVTYGKQL